LFAWRNDAETIRNSLTGKCVTRKEHEKWFKNVINSPEYKIFIAVKPNHHPIGVVRYTMKKKKNFEVHINLNPRERGKGWGSRLIKRCNNLLKRSAAGSRVVAQVKEDNFPSQSVFERAGYRRHSKTGGTITYQSIL